MQTLETILKLVAGAGLVLFCYEIVKAGLYNKRNRRKSNTISDLKMRANFYKGKK